MNKNPFDDTDSESEAETSPPSPPRGPFPQYRFYPSDALTEDYGVGLFIVKSRSDADELQTLLVRVRHQVLTSMERVLQGVRLHRSYGDLRALFRELVTAERDLSKL